MASLQAATNAFSKWSIVRPLVGGVGAIYSHHHARTIFLFSKEKEVDRQFLKMLQNPLELSPESLKKIWKQRKEVLLKDDQRYLELRHQVLGPDLATAHFVIARGGAVKMAGHDKWYVKDEDGRVPLPGRRTSNIFVEGIDASGMNLMFHGLENFKNLDSIKYLNLSDCPHIDDWCMDRLVWFRKTLVYLDISRCPKVTERGLSALHKLEKLRRLHVSDMSGVKHRPLAAMLLEESMPNCIVEGIDYTDRTELDQIQPLEDIEDPFLKGLSSISAQKLFSN